MNALSATPDSFFTLAISHMPISDILAKFAYDILQVFEKKDITLYSNSNAVRWPILFIFLGISGLGLIPIYNLLLK